MYLKTSCNQNRIKLNKTKKSIENTLEDYLYLIQIIDHENLRGLRFLTINLMRKKTYVIKLDV